MQRSLNYTGRRRITRDDIAVRVGVSASGQLVARIDLTLAHYDFPTDARVYAEAYRRTDYERFDLGLLRDAAIQKEVALNTPSASGGLLFRIKVVEASASTRRLLGVADHVQAIDVAADRGPRPSLLPVQSADLQGEIWRVGFDAQPILYIDRAWYSRRTALLKSPHFAPIVFPVVLRQVLLRVLTGEGDGIKNAGVDLDCPDDWRSAWMRFAMTCGATSSVPNSDAADIEEVDAWVDEVVAAFARKQKVADRFAAEFVEALD